MNRRQQNRYDAYLICADIIRQATDRGAIADFSKGIETQVLKIRDSLERRAEQVERLSSIRAARKARKAGAA